MALSDPQVVDAEPAAVMTAHAARRMPQRAISHAALDTVLRWGAQIEQNGATVFFLGRRHLPADVAPADAARLEGTVAVVARDGAVITTFRCRRLPSGMRRRPRRSSRHPSPWTGLRTSPVKVY